MPDLLIRNLEPDLKRLLEVSARAHGKSLSDEAKALLNRALAEDRPRRPVGTALVEHFRTVRPVDFDIPRDELPEHPPALE